MNGGDDGARTRDLCRDSPPFWRNSLKPGVMDGNLMRPKDPVGTVIVPLMCPRQIFGDLCPTSFPERIFRSSSDRRGANISQRKRAHQARLLPRVGRGCGSKLAGGPNGRQVGERISDPRGETMLILVPWKPVVFVWGLLTALLLLGYAVYCVQESRNPFAIEKNHTQSAHGRHSPGLGAPGPKHPAKTTQQLHHIRVKRGGNSGCAAPSATALYPTSTLD